MVWKCEGAPRSFPLGGDRYEELRLEKGKRKQGLRCWFSYKVGSPTCFFGMGESILRNDIAKREELSSSGRPGMHMKPSNTSMAKTKSISFDELVRLQTHNLICPHCIFGWIELEDSGVRTRRRRERFTAVSTS